MAQTLENLIAQLESEKPYKALSEDDIRKQAQNRYQSEYGQKRLEAQQSFETSDAALARELSGLQASYDSRRASAQKQTNDAYSQADRHSLSRGMQRSSYNEANLTNVLLAGQAEQHAIDREQTQKEADVAEKRTQLSTQLAQTLRQLDSDRQSDEQAYIDELTEREYQREQDSRANRDALTMQLYEYRRQLEKDAQEQSRWVAEFNAKYGK